MEPKQSFFSKNTDSYPRPNGSAKIGTSHPADLHGTIVDSKKTQKSQIMSRLQDLEKQNDGLKNIIEERKDEIADILAANKKYISVLAHDLRSPFSTIFGVLGILRDCIHDSNYDEMEKYIDIASSYSLNTTNLIENILAWAHSQSKDKQFNPIRVNLAGLVEREIENSKLVVKLKNISLSHTIPKSLMVRADLNLSQSIVRNLISNAIKFTHSGGNIIISAKQIQFFCEIGVKDDGIGICEKDQKTLFEKDLPLTATSNSNGRGKGLGLILCKEFAEMHGGSMRVESQLGKGSGFFFTLPIDEQ